MKKRIWHLSRRVVVCTVFLFVQQFIQSQVSNPSTWESFVQSNANISIRDTFRMQTFEGLASDNWDYAITGEAGSPDKPGGLSIQLCKSEKKEFYIRYSS